MEFNDAILWDVQVPGHPFGAVATADGGQLFVSLVGPPAHGVAVLRVEERTAQLIDVVPLDHDGLGLTLNPEGTLLAVANFAGGVSLLEVEGAAERPRLIGQVDTGRDMGTFHVRFSADGTRLFATEEKASVVSVIGSKGVGATMAQRQAMRSISIDQAIDEYGSTTALRTTLRGTSPRPTETCS